MPSDGVAASLCTGCPHVMAVVLQAIAGTMCSGSHAPGARSAHEQRTQHVIEQAQLQLGDFACCMIWYTVARVAQLGAMAWCAVNGP